jgi:hypothetical protein
MSTMKRIQDTLSDYELPMTMGELMAQGDIDKRFAGDVSSCLSKLVARGAVVRVEIERKARLGRKKVSAYRWVVVEYTPPPPPPIVVEDDPRRMLGAPLLIGRIG